LTRNSHAAQAPAAARSSHPCHAVIAANVMPGTVPVETPSG
jgi:hypothetical protein